MIRKVVSMQSFANQSFVGWSDADSARTYSDLDFHDCEFQSCGLSTTRDPTLRSTVRNVSLVRTSIYGCFVTGAVLDNVVVDSLDTHGDTLQTWATVFRHVVLKGKIDYVMTSGAHSPGRDFPETESAFAAANARFYQGIDWALDISKGEFKDLVVRGVPARLIRRDPESQAVVLRAALLDHPWRELPFANRVTNVSLGIFLEQGHADFVYVAGKRDRRYRQTLEDIELLRREGLATHD
jgi:hypothetical protein